MDKAIILIMGAFLYSVVGFIVNYILYYGTFLFRLIGEFMYFILSVFGITTLGITLVNIIFYFLIFKLFYAIIQPFING